MGKCDIRAIMPLIIAMLTLMQTAIGTQATQTWSYLRSFSDHPFISGWYTYMQALKQEHHYASSHAPLYCIIPIHAYASFLHNKEIYAHYHQPHPYLSALVSTQNNHMDKKQHKHHLIAHLGMFINPNTSLPDTCHIPNDSLDLSIMHTYLYPAIPQDYRYISLQILVPIESLKKAVFLEDRHTTHIVYHTYQALCKNSTDAHRHIQHAHNTIALPIDQLSQEERSNIHITTFTPGVTQTLITRIEQHIQWNIQ